MRKTSRLAGEVLPAGRSALTARPRRARATPRLLERRRAGQVRHCHGDLHLGNIVLLEGPPVLFDCLEFDEALASIDTLYDLAFLVMDLEHQARRPAQRLLSSYLEATWDDGGVALLPLFLACRAAIRSKVVGFGAGQATEALRSPRSPRRGHTSSVRSLTVAAAGPADRDRRGLRYGQVDARQALAPELGPAPGAVILRSDVARKRLLGMAPARRSAPEAYPKEASGMVYDDLAARAAALRRRARGDRRRGVPRSQGARADRSRRRGGRRALRWPLALCARGRAGAPRRGAPRRRLGCDARSRAAATGYRPRRDVVAGPGGERAAGRGCDRGAKSISLGTSRSYTNRNVASQIAKAKPTVDEHRSPAPYPAHKA